MLPRHRFAHRPLLAWYLVSIAILSALTIPSLADDAGTASDWSYYRGPQGDGTLEGSGVFDGLETPGIEVAWNREIGSGYSGIVVAGDRLVTLFAAGENDVVAAFSTADGRELWRTVLGPTYGGHDGSHDGPISTPAIAEGRVFALGAWGRLLALDLATGEEVWSTHLAEDHEIPKPHYGFATSPRIAAGVLVVELGGDDKAVAGFDPASGELRWSVGSDAVSYQTPVPWNFEGRDLLLAVGDKTLIAVDPASGEALWQVPHDGQGARGVASLTPVPAGGARLFLPHQNDGSKMVEVVRKDGEVTLETLWEGRAIRNSYNVPVYHDGHLYGFSSRILACLDAETGEARWRSREPGDGFLILVDGLLVITTKEGGFHVAEASPEGYRELTGATIFDEVAWSFPSLAGGSFFARSLGELARVEVRSGGVASASAAGNSAGGGSSFAQFVTAVESAEAADRPALVEKFFAEQQSFPVVEGNTAHFVFRGEATDVGIAGDMFGNRREEAMTRLADTDVYYHSAELALAARLQYLFLIDFEPTLDPLNPDRKVEVSMFGDDMEMAWRGGSLPMSWFHTEGWQAPDHLVDSPEERRGQVENHSLTSEALDEGAEIAVAVYLPAGYDPDGEGRYPVAYVHSGPGAFEHGQLARSLDQLVGRSVEPLIVVAFGIPAQGPAYAQVLTEDILPWVDANYRTRQVASDRASIGTGFLGTPALMTTIGHSDLFGKLGIQSPYFFSSSAGMVEAQLAENEGWAPAVVYLDWGTYDLRNPHEGWSVVDESHQLLDLLKEQGVEPKGGEAADGTGWPAWRNRTDALFETLFPLAD